jgi:hypothetical protein
VKLLTLANTTKLINLRAVRNFYTMKGMLGLLLFISLAASGQTIKTNIENTKTAGHVNIPGTRVYIVPPPNFTVATAFTGLQKGDRSAVNVMELIGGNFYTNAGTFSKAEFEKRGIKVFDFKEITIDGYPARYISLQGDVSTKGYGVVFGDTTFSTMIMAMYPATDEVTGRDVINSLNTIYYDKGKKVDPMAAAFFTLDEKVSKFKFLKSAASTYIYTIGGTETEGNQDVPMLVVTQLPRDASMTLKSIADGMISKEREYGFSDFETRSSSTRKINGYDAYELEVDAKFNGEKTRNYYLVVGKDDKAVVIMGTAKKDVENTVGEFKKIAGSVRFK